MLLVSDDISHFLLIFVAVSHYKPNFVCQFRGFFLDKLIHAIGNFAGVSNNHCLSF
ncbi:hypothetical protein D3C73_692680 [compost metagenome]